jgi:N-acetylglucosaminyldiphosphoundecaprenol N-acetyl-beta-D-mannosaminyltransferase
MKSKNNSILSVPIQPLTRNEILEYIKKYILSPQDFFHVVSLNPENMVIIHENDNFKRVATTAQIRIVDGVGVAIAGKVLGVPTGERMTGVDLMDELLKVGNEFSLSALLIGGRANLAQELAECYRRTYGQIKVRGIEGFKDIKTPTIEEEREIFSIVAATRPRLLFVAFGSPWQELWLYQHREKLQGIVCMGVGGAFDYLSGKVGRPPRLIRAIGLEWLYRLLIQPWRWKRQLRLLTFIWLVFLQRFGLLK